MALHTELDIYKSAYQLMDVAVGYVVNLPRSVKHSIGTRLIDLCVGIMLLILKINCIRNVKERIPHLDTLLEHKEETGLLLRLCKDKKFISPQQYGTAIELVTSVGKQAMAWRNKCATTA